MENNIGRYQGVEVSGFHTIQSCRYAWRSVSCTQHTQQRDPRQDSIVKKDMISPLGIYLNDINH